VTVIVFNNLSYDGERNRIYRGSPLAAKKETRGLWRDISCFLGNPEVDFVGLADSFEIQGKRANNPEEFVECLLEAAKVTADGRPFLIDLRVMQLDTSGKPTEQTWHPDISIAAKRMKKI
jgi:thiamine pyrophosphate-dependent acetolactate synthase large subunit-like protein